MADHHSSPSYESGQKLSAPKDRQCIFCSQWFTSSSLGRHYDQFIKPHNPKAADGVHNVRAIAEMRGSITRRQARGSKRKTSNAQASLSSHQAISEDGESSISLSPTNSAKMSDTMGMKFNKVPWWASGVINDIPNRKDSAISLSLDDSLRLDDEEKERLVQRIEDGRNADLARQEVLGSIQKANARSYQQTLFNFNPFKLSFPGLCLRILKSPPTIQNSTMPFPTADSWTIQPPTTIQVDALRIAVNAQLTRIKRQQLTHATELPVDFASLDDDANKILQHISNAWTQWAVLTEPMQREAWQLEALRQYARSEDSCKQADMTVNALRGEFAVLLTRQQRSSVDESDCELGGSIMSPYSSYSPDLSSSHSPNLSSGTLKSRSTTVPDPSELDYESLATKYKKMVRLDQRPSSYQISDRSLLSDPLGLDSSLHGTSFDDWPFSIDGSLDDESPIMRSPAFDNMEVKFPQPQLTLNMGDLFKDDLSTSPLDHRQTSLSGQFQWGLPMSSDDMNSLVNLNMGSLDELQIQTSSTYA